jgi:hypothetical protein
MLNASQRAASPDPSLTAVAVGAAATNWSGRGGLAALDGAPKPAERRRRSSPRLNLEMSSSTTSPKTFAEDCRKRFLLADADMSGTLDKTEVRTLVRALGFGLISDEYLAGCWDVFDANGDGVLDLQEVQEMVQVLLAK